MVYLDVLFLTEWIMNDLVLLLYCRIRQKNCKRRMRLGVSAVITGISTACMVVVNRNRGWRAEYAVAESVILAFLETGLLAFLQKAGRKKAVQRKKKRMSARAVKESCLRNLLELPALLFSAFALAGALGAIEGQRRGGSTAGLWFSGVCAAAVLCMGWEVIFWKNRSQGVVRKQTVWITAVKDTYTVTAITDTGNHLYDRRTGRPVHIAEQDRILSEEEKERLLLEKPESVSFLPYASLGNPEGILMVLTVKKMVVLCDDRKLELENQEIGLTGQRLSPDGSWQMLLHPDLEACLLKKGNCERREQ